MEIIVDFPGGARSDAHFGAFAVATDQPADHGGQNAAPTPFEMFLASIATCAGFYVLGFCKMRGISSEGIRLIQRMERDPSTKMVRKIYQDIQLPPGFPEQYVSAIKRAADSCLVKKHLEAPPEFEISTTIRT
jgi:putative redox protein